MSKLQIRGVIVGPEYDTSWADQYIEKGMIIPESRFRKALAEAPKNEPMELYINSPGGSVFAANEMVNALREWKMETNQPVKATLGAKVASAAASLTIQSADEVTAHKNAMMMFHGAWTGIVGGSDALKDEAGVLDRINGEIKTRLLSKYNLAPETVTDWFREGREGWLNVDELKAAGIVQNVLDSDSDKIKFPKEDVIDLEQRGLKVAAMIEMKEADDVHNESDPTSAAPASPVGDGANDPPAPADPKDQEIETLKGELSALQAKLVESEEQRRAAQSVKDKMAAARLDAEKKHGSALAEIDAKHKAEVEQAKAEQDAAIKSVSSELLAVKSTLEQMMAGSMTYSAPVETWEDALKACGGDASKAAATYPDQYQARCQQSGLLGRKTAGWRTK